MRSDRSEAAATVEMQCDVPGTRQGTSVQLSVRRPRSPMREALQDVTCPRCGRALTVRVLSRSGLRRRRLLYGIWGLVFLAVLLLTAGVAYLLWPSLQGPGLDWDFYRNALWLVIEACGLAVLMILWSLRTDTGVTLVGEADGPPPARPELREPELHRIEE